MNLTDKPAPEPPLRADPKRLHLPDTGYYFRALNAEGRWDSIDIIHLDLPSVVSLLRSRELPWIQSLFDGLSARATITAPSQEDVQGFASNDARGLSLSTLRALILAMLTGAEGSEMTTEEQDAIVKFLRKE